MKGGKLIAKSVSGIGCISDHGTSERFPNQERTQPLIVLNHFTSSAHTMTIRINFAVWPPWTIPTEVRNTTILLGIVKEIYDVILGALNFQYTATLQHDMTFGAKDAEGNWNGMIGSSLKNETDISGPYFVSQERSTAVEFSLPLAFSQQSIMSGLVPANREPLLIFKIFTIQVWLLMIVSTILASGVATFIYTMYPSRNKNTKRRAFFKYVWAFYGTLLGKEFGESKRWFMKSVLVTASFRLLLCVWLIGPVLVLMYTYQGAITSTFASNKLKPKIETLDELHESNDVIPSTFKNSFPFTCLRHLRGTHLDSLVDRVSENLKIPETNSVPKWLDDIEEGKLAFMAEVRLMKAMVGDRFKKTGRCGIYVTPIDLCPAYMAFGFRQNYNPELKKKFNKRLLWFGEARLYHRQMIASIANYDICTQASSNTVKPLDMNDLLGAFIVYCIGFCISVFVFFLEKTIKHQKLSDKT